MKLLFFIINLKAGNGISRKIWREVEEELKRKDIRYKSFFTEYPKHATTISKEICKRNRGEVEAIIAVGGDGTVNEVINGMADYDDVKVGYIPAGSGNDFSRGFSLPSTSIEALEYILENSHNKPNKFDIGRFKTEEMSKEQYFVSSLGAGFDAAVSMLTNQSKMKKYFNKIRLGSLAYVGAVVRMLFTYKRTDLTITLDHEKLNFNNVWFITVSNQAYYGGGMKIAPQAKTNDGLLDITIVNNLSRIKLLLVFGSVFFGTHTRFKEVAQYTSSSISVHSNSELPVHADGEYMGNTPLQASVIREKLAIIGKDE